MACSFDDSPIKPGIDGRRVKTFEELLELNIDESELNPTTSSKPKQPFLKKGTGLAKYKLNDIFDEPPNRLPKQLEKAKPVLKRVQGAKIDRPPPRVSYLAKRNNKPSHLLTPPKKNVQKHAKSNVSVLPRIRGTSLPAGMIKHDGSTVNRHENLGSASGDEELSSSIDNLERLLESVQTRKHELLNPPKVESSCRETDSSDDQSDQIRKMVVRSHKKMSKKKVRWREYDEYASPKQSSEDEEEDDALSSVRVGPHTSSLQNNIKSLEQRLSELQLRCARKKAEATVPDEPKLATNFNSALATEVSDLKNKLSSLSNNLQALQFVAASKSTNAQKPISNKAKPNRKILVERETAFNIKNSRGQMMNIDSTLNNTSVKFSNGDEMDVLKDETVTYRYKNGTTQTTYTDGTKLIEFPNGQTERVHPNGTKKISYPSRLQRTVNPDGSEELEMTDGTIVHTAVDGTEIVQLPNGEREIRSKEYHRREYKNGTIRTVYANGTQETRYANGRLRIKDKDNNLIVDSVVRCLDQIRPV